MSDVKIDVDYAFLDSGTGGIPYMQFLKKMCPSARCVYMGDTRNFPYGTKSKEEIVECASRAVEKILSRWNPKTIVIACNTISVTALDELRRRFSPVLFVGTVPAIKLAARISRNKNIGLLATDATVTHPYTLKLIEDFASDCHVFSRGDGALISFIEKKLFTASDEEKLSAIKPALDFFRQHDCDAIVLACTHFLLMAEDIQKAAGPEVTVVDSREGVARQALKVEGLKCDAAGAVSCDEKIALYVTGENSPEEEKEYVSLCQRNGMLWGGTI